MNPIKQLYSDLTNVELEVLVKEIRESEKTGVFQNESEIRNLCRKTSEITRMDVSSNLLMVQLGVLKEAAFRWLEKLETEN